MSVEPDQGRYVDTEIVQLVNSTPLYPEPHQPGDAGLPMLVVGEGNHSGYLCVERGDVADRAVVLQPGSKSHTWMNLSY